jgi:hypothetical protein
LDEKLSSNLHAAYAAGRGLICRQSAYLIGTKARIVI